MRTRKMKLVPATRVFNFHARFTPDGPDAIESTAFSGFWFAAMDRIHKLQGKQLAQRKAQVARFLAARRKADPILIKVLRNEIPVELAAQKVKRLVPDKEMLRKLFDVWNKAAKATPEQVAEEKKDIERRKREIAHSERLHKARKAIVSGLTTLAEATEAGDTEAAKNLAEATIQASVLLGIAEKRHPELLKPVAHNEMMWPVLASEEAGWEKDALRHIADLKLGADRMGINVRFRKARGTDANLPARLWAKAAVRTIEETQFRILSFGQVLREFGSQGALADFCLETNWRIGEQPEWVHDASGLKIFSRESLPSWKLAVRKLIREQIPDFHTRPEWTTQRNTAAASGRATPGEIQNAILDDITSALVRLVPDSIMPKSTC
jgi:hypothetical protein